MASSEEKNPRKREDPPDQEWSEEFQCPIINGVLAPWPLSSAPYVESTEPDLEETGDEIQKAPKSAKKMRGTSPNEGSVDVYFKLFKFVRDGEQYILEMHQDESTSIYRCHVVVYDENGQWNVGVYDLPLGDHVVFPVTEDPKPLIFDTNNVNLSLEHRLTGWRVEVRTRNSGHQDRFHYHGDRQFRSFVEVATFIVYACKPKEMKLCEYYASRMPNLNANNPRDESQNPEEGKPDEMEKKDMEDLSEIFEEDD